MSLLLGLRVSTEDCFDLRMDCPCCGTTNALGHVRQRTEQLMLLHLIPLIPFRNIFVRCDSCQKASIARCSLGELKGASPLALKEFLYQPTPLVGKTCIWLGILLCWAPIIGLIPAVIGFFYRNAYGRGMKTMSIVGLILSALTTGFILYIAATSPSHG